MVNEVSDLKSMDLTEELRISNEEQAVQLVSKVGFFYLQHISSIFKPPITFSQVVIHFLPSFLPSFPPSFLLPYLLWFSSIFFSLQTVSALSPFLPSNFNSHSFLYSFSFFLLIWQESELISQTEIVEALRTKLKILSSEYERKLSAVSLKHQSSIEETLKNIYDKKQMLDKQSETLSHSFISGHIDINTFLQASSNYIITQKRHFFHIFFFWPNNSQLYVRRIKIFWRNKKVIFPLFYFMLGLSRLSLILFR